MWATPQRPPQNKELHRPSKLRTRACYEQPQPRCQPARHPTVGSFDRPKHEALALTLDSHCWKQGPLILLRGLGSSVSFLGGRHTRMRDLPGRPVARTLHSQCGGPGFDPRSGSWVIHAEAESSHKDPTRCNWNLV